MFAADDSRCLYRNGGCGGLCIPAEGAVRCKCEETRRLQKDGVTCSARESLSISMDISMAISLAISTSSSARTRRPLRDKIELSNRK